MIPVGELLSNPQFADYNNTGEECNQWNNPSSQKFKRQIAKTEHKWTIKMQSKEYNFSS